MSTCNCNGACRMMGVRCPAADLPPTTDGSEPYIEQLPSYIISRLAPQPPPVNIDHLPASWSLVVADMNARDEQGRAKYGVPLRPHNGRDQLVDAYQEALDLAVYLRTAIYERDGR